MEENGEVAPTLVKTTLESLRICLFSNKESAGVKKNLDLMKNRYNFFIHDVECLINLKGLLSYLAERIQLGMLCLGCSKQFSSARRCQQHMIDKRHCFMNPDDEEEYEEFYDYSLQYEGMNLPKKPEAIEEDKAREALWA
jgi:pre-60S factor REI1